MVGHPRILLVSGTDTPLIDTDLAPVPLNDRAVIHAGGVLPALGESELIGSRSEIRATIRSLRQGQAVVLTGVGGIGKSSVAGRLAKRLAAEDWVTSTTQGPFNLAGVFAQLQFDLTLSKAVWANQLADGLARLPADDNARIAGLMHALQHCRLLLVFDNFEDNLTIGGSEFDDPVVAAVIGRLATAGGVGSVLITCRYPLPGFTELFEAVDLPR